METQLATTLNGWCFDNTNANFLLPPHDLAALNNNINREMHCAESTLPERNIEPTDAIPVPRIQPPHQQDHADVYQIARTQEDISETTPSPLSLPGILYGTDTTSPSSSTLLVSSTNTNTSTSTAIDISTNINTCTTPTSHTTSTPPPPDRPKRGRPRFDLTYPQHANDPSRAARLAKGRLAARKHRERHSQKVELLQDLYTQRASRNEELKSEVSALREELLELKSAVLRHADCGVCPIEKYIARKMLQFVDS